MLDIEDWIDVNESELHELALRSGLTDGAMHFVAALVLGGRADEVVLGELRKLSLPPEGGSDRRVEPRRILEDVRTLAGRVSESSSRSEPGHQVTQSPNRFVVEAWAPDRSRCLEEFVRGVADTLADTHMVTATREVPLEVGSALDEDVVSALLADMRRLLVDDDLVVVDIALDEEDDGNFAGMFFVAPRESVLRTGIVPKGISHSDMERGGDGSRWQARVFVEV